MGMKINKKTDFSVFLFYKNFCIIFCETKATAKISSTRKGVRGGCENPFSSNNSRENGRLQICFKFLKKGVTKKRRVLFSLQFFIIIIYIIL